MQAAKDIAGARHAALDILAERHIRLYMRCLAARLKNQFAGDSGTLGIDIRHHHAGAFPGKGQGGGAARAGTATHHKRYLVLHFLHQHAPRTSGSVSARAAGARLSAPCARLA